MEKVDTSSGKANNIYYNQSKRSKSKLKKIVNDHDPKAFISVFETNEVRGYRFKERFI